MTVLDDLRQADQALGALSPWPHPLPLGRLAPAVAGVLTALPKGDWILAGPRQRVGLTLRGCPVERLVDPRQGARPWKLAPTTGRADTRALHAVGLALGGDAPACCLLGMASMASGATWEALNTAVLTGARVLFVCLDEGLPADAPVARQLARPAVELARAAGLAVHELELAASASSEALAQAARDAVLAARAQMLQDHVPAFLSISLR